MWNGSVEPCFLILISEWLRPNVILMSLTTFATAAIFVLAYAGVLLGRIPQLTTLPVRYCAQRSRFDVRSRHANLEFVKL
jgi:hypothetical protein